MNSPAQVPLVVAFGSNLGHRLANLAGAFKALAGHGIPISRWSSVVRTPPLGGLDQPDFLNLVALAETRLPPGEVLSIFKAVERDAGRMPGARHEPRPLDLDLVFFDGRIVRERGLKVPHPRWRERSFVVTPLTELCPGFRDPETGLTVLEVARRWPLEPGPPEVFATVEEFRSVLEAGSHGLQDPDAQSIPGRTTGE
jgi:2-amino-4-hydroxy-6-hydroxymethyldihydropteridine diphosphokinase